MEELKFLIQRCSWFVTKLYSYFTFEQDTFKKEFALHNQKERQNAKIDVEKYFYKLMNNANFGVDCKNYLNNLTFEPIIDEVNEINYYHLFNKKISNFVNSDILEKKMEQKLGQKLANSKDNYPFKSSGITYINNDKTDQMKKMKK